VPLPDLTNQQCELVRFEGSLFVEACPGAGKTRAIVARFLRCTAEETRKGIGLLSFTNAAIDEVTKRCGEQPHARLAPNFVGTFDSFINRFITRPLYVRQYGRTPRFIESWQNVPSASFRIGGMDRMPDLHLDWFEFDPSLRATFRVDWVPVRNQRTIAPLISTSQRLMEVRAATVCRDLVKSGTLSCAASRAIAAGYLSDPATYKLVGTLLAARFKEVIVDEAQDCGPEELLVLTLLQQYGVQIVAVADLDQSIFEFRRADPAAVRSFADSLATTLPLDGNFRSSPAICSLNVSLRHGHRPESAVGDNAALATPVQLIGFRRDNLLASRVEAIAARHGLVRQQAIFLAHRGADARKHAGARETAIGANNRVLGIASAHAVLRSASSTSRERLRAIETVEATIRAVVQVAGQDEGGFGGEALDERWLREVAVRLALDLDPSGLQPRTYAAQIRDHLQQIAWPAGVTLKDLLGSRIKAPPADEWQITADDPGAFAAATIHSVKGREFPAVVIVFPANLLKDNAGHHAVDHWSGETAAEVRRVIYVGASRAEQLLILAVHSNHLEQVVSLLERDAVPHELHREGPGEPWP
jgi:DNA helicase II / ATP-dependent DNA helicase PcrA